MQLLGLCLENTPLKSTLRQSQMLAHTGKRTYKPTMQYACHCRCHIDILPYHEIGADWRNVIRAAWSFPPVLLAYNPHSAVVDLCPILRWVLADHKFQPLHCPQTSLEGFPRLDQMVEILIVKRLGANDRVVGGRIEEGRFRKVGED